MLSVCLVEPTRQSANTKKQKQKAFGFGGTRAARKRLGHGSAFRRSLWKRLITPVQRFQLTAAGCFAPPPEAQSEEPAARLLLSLSKAAFGLVRPVFSAPSVWVFFPGRCPFFSPPSGVNIILSIIRAPVASHRLTVYQRIARTVGEDPCVMFCVLDGSYYILSGSPVFLFVVINKNPWHIGAQKQ